MRYLAHKIRLYPNARQRALMAKTVDTSRYVYNWALATWMEWYKDAEEGRRADKPNYVKLSAMWTQVKPEWAFDTPRTAQARAIKDVANAFVMYFRHGAKRPKFHKKGVCANTFYIDNDIGKVKGTHHIKFPLIGTMRMAEPVRFSGKIQSFVVSEYAGKWFVSVKVAVEDTRKAGSSKCGIDVGMKTPAVCSDGTQLKLPEEHLARLDKRLRKAQQVMMRRQVGSTRRAKALRRKQRIQEKINNIRKDRIDKFTSAVCKNHATVVIEKLDCDSMHRVASKRIRSGMQRSCMAEVHRQLEYKAICLVKADAFFPSSQLCSNCGARQKLKLTQRVYKCPHCGCELDRDLNAAINLSHYPGSPGE